MAKLAWIAVMMMATIINARTVWGFVGGSRVTPGLVKYISDRTDYRRRFLYMKSAEISKGSSRGRKNKIWQGPFAYHEELVLRVDGLTNLGQGICRANVKGSEIGQEDLENWVVMVRTVIPGELVRLRIYRNHKNYSEADLLEVLEPSPHRTTPACPLFGQCGGCQYQHMTIEAQRDWKRQHVLDVLNKTANISDVRANASFGTSHVLGYRSKITPHHEKPRYGEIRDIGFLKMGSRSLLDVPECAIATPRINERLAVLRQDVRDASRRAFAENSGKKARGATLFLRETNEGVTTDPREEVSDTVGDLTFRYTAGSFFQNNPYVLPHLVSYVLCQAKARGQQFLVDAYCGGGLFCLSASKDFKSCYGVEVSELAVASARQNAELNDISNCHFQAGDASDIFAGLQHIEGKDTVVIVDPPRKGCDEDFLRQLFQFRPARIVYVSCDPATQARDAQSLLVNGYAIEDVQPFDLFPQTRHIENVITFTDGSHDSN